MKKIVFVILSVFLISPALFSQSKNNVNVNVNVENRNGQFDEWTHKESLNRLSFGVAVMFR